MTSPAATIVIPAYNNEGTIVRTLDSVAAAIAFHKSLRDDDFEIIVVDDASRDATPRLVRDWAEVRSDTHLIAFAENKGSCHARNAGAAQAHAPILFFLDADDDFLPPHVYCCLEALRGLPDAGFARPHLKFDAEIHESWRSKLRYVLPSNLCVRKSCHEFIGGFFEHDHLRVHRIEDIIYTLMVTRYFGGVLLDLATVYHRSYPGNAFDRQLAKFRQPAGDSPEGLTAAEMAVQPAIDALVAARLGQLDEKARYAPPSSPPRLILGAKPPVWYARGIGDWLDERLKSAGLAPNKVP